MNNKIQKIIDNKNQKLSKKQESGNFNQILSIQENELINLTVDESFYSRKRKNKNK